MILRLKNDELRAAENEYIIPEETIALRSSYNHLDKKVEFFCLSRLPDMCGLDLLMFSGGAVGAESLVSRLADFFVGVVQPRDVQPRLMLKFGFSNLCLRIPLCACSFI